MISLKLSVPTSVVIDQQVSKIIAEGMHGSFCVLPGHTDYLSPLVPGILIFTDTEGREHYIANDHGLLVKQGRDVFVSVRRAQQSESLETLQKTVHDHFLRLNENDRVCQTAVASLEARFLRKFLELQAELS